MAEAFPRAPKARKQRPDSRSISPSVQPVATDLRWPMAGRWAWEKRKQEGTTLHLQWPTPPMRMTQLALGKRKAMRRPGGRKKSDAAELQHGGHILRRW